MVRDRTKASQFVAAMKRLFEHPEIARVVQGLPNIQNDVALDGTHDRLHKTIDASIQHAAH